MDLEPDQIIDKNVFPQTSFLRGKVAQEFFVAVKQNEYDKVEEYLDKDRFIVYEYDLMGMTALHWAAKRNFY